MSRKMQVILSGDTFRGALAVYYGTRNSSELIGTYSENSGTWTAELGDGSRHSAETKTGLRDQITAHIEED